MSNDKKKKAVDPKEPTVATGMDDDEELERDATKAEIESGDYTEVTKLSYED